MMNNAKNVAGKCGTGGNKTNGIAYIKSTWLLADWAAVCALKYSVEDHLAQLCGKSLNRGAPWSSM